MASSSADFFTTGHRFPLDTRAFSSGKLLIFEWLPKRHRIQPATPSRHTANSHRQKPVSVVARPPCLLGCHPRTVLVAVMVVVLRVVLLFPAPSDFLLPALVEYQVGEPGIRALVVVVVVQLFGNRLHQVGIPLEDRVHGKRCHAVRTV